MTRLLALGCAILASAGCLDIHPADGAWKCGTAPGNQCPTGYVCDPSANSCVLDSHYKPPTKTTMHDMSMMSGGGVPDVGHTAVTLSSTTVAADGKSSGTATVTVADADGNPVSGVTIAWKASDAFTSFVNQSSTTTDGNGVVSTGIVSTAGGGKSITAVVTWDIAGVSGTFEVSPSGMLQFQSLPSADKSSLGFVPGSGVMANNASEVNANIVIKDYSGAIMVGVPVGLTATGGGVTIDSPPAVTNALGVSSAGFKSSTAGDKQITLTANGVVLLTQPYTFAPVSVFTLKFLTSSIQTNGHDLPQITVAAFDSTSTPLTTLSAPITLALAADQQGTPSTGVLGGSGSTTVMTGADGTATFNSLTAAPAGGAACSSTTHNCTFYLKASTPGGNGSAVSVVTGPFTVSDGTLATPGNLTVAHRADKPSSITVGWSPVTGATGYWVMRSTSQQGGFNPLTTVPVTATTYTDASLIHGIYYYEVLATTKTSASDNDPTHTNSAPQTPAGDEAWREICVANYKAATSGVVVLPADSSATSAVGTSPAAIRAINSDKDAAMIEPYAVAVDVPTTATMAPTRIFAANYLQRGEQAGMPVGYTSIGVYNRTADTLSQGTLLPTTEIHVVHPAGTAATQIEAAARLTGIAYDNADDEVIVIDQSAPAILAFNLASPATYKWALYGTTSAVVGPVALAINNTGSDVEIYVANIGTPAGVGTSQSINVYSRNAIAKAGFGDVTTVGPTRVINNYNNAGKNTLSNPYGLAVTGGYLFVANSSTGGSVTQFHLSDGNSSSTGVAPINQFTYGGFKTPESLAVDIANDNLFVLNSGGLINVFSVSGTYKGDISPGGLVSPTSISFCN